ncbi:uncharacterized protein TM35_000491190 [Trypanosoma theileri]|uniref:Uncharacterized protein n=1 Tax=Trypanosoma theileri TaxID=67003 RepID=A0A1X0NI20_9TRYP|nr:uncharacterized protein TM35_000491190 [Trypanosoma theileri]ORC84113.1 hypothetical protein TM35_000491190 [Trypanosoma theileri]
MNSSCTENDYDLFTVDRTFILSLFHAFCTAVPDDIRTKLAKSEADALQFLMVLRPRLTSFSHRRVTSLRHPAVSMAARRYFNAQRTAIREEARLHGEFAASTHTMNLSTNTVNTNVAARASCVGSVTSSVNFNADQTNVGSLPLPFIPNVPAINMMQLMQNKWNLLGPCYEVLLRNSRPRIVAAQVIEANDMVNDIICRYWERITVPPGEYVDMDQSFSLDVSDSIGEGGGASTSTFSRRFGDIRRSYATHMTALQYVYLNLRISSVLLPPDTLESEMLDSIIVDLRIDATPRRKLDCLSFDRPPRLYGHRDSDDVHAGLHGLNSTLQRLREAATRELAQTAVSLETAEGATSVVSSESAKGDASEGPSTLAATGTGTGTTATTPAAAIGGTDAASNVDKKSVIGNDNVDCSLSNLPDISFGQFWRSMLELADNWTSTTHPMEQAMFLMELYCEVFAHEWDDEDTALMKTLRTTAAERSTRRQDDLLSLYDDSDRSSYMMSEFNQMLSSVAEFAAFGTSYAPNLSRKGVRSIVDEYISSVPRMFATPEGSMDGSGSFGSIPGVRRITAVGTGTAGEEERRSHRHSLSVSSWLITDSGSGSTLSGEVEGEGAGKRRRHGRERGKRDGSGKRRRRRGTDDDDDDVLSGSDVDALHAADSKDSSLSFDSLLTEGGKRRRHHLSKRDSSSMGLAGEDHEDEKMKKKKLRSGSASGGGRRKRDEHGKSRDGSRHRLHGSSSGSGSGSGSDAGGSSKPPWGSDSSLEYSVPDEELTPLSLWRRQQEREARRRRRRRREKQKRSSQAGLKETEGASAKLSASELAERRARLVEALRAKGITLAADFLSDDDIIQLTSDTIDPELLRRLMQGAGFTRDELSEEDFLRIMLGEDDQLLGPGADAADKNSVLAALRKRVSRNPPETAYARRRRELQEQLLREQERAAARAARRREKRKAHHKSRTDTSESPSPAETPLTEFESPSPSPSPDTAELFPTDRERKRREKQQQQQQEEELDMESSSSDSLAGLWTSAKQRVLTPPPERPGLPRPNAFLPSPSVPRLFMPSVAPEIIYDEAPEVHLHSEEKLEMFYRHIRKDQPIKGRAPLLPQTSIRGGTYHQMSLVRARLGQGKQKGEEEEPQERRCAPVKLFSLTTKTTFSEALRESLQRYVDDKTYLDTLYGSYSK